MLTEFMPKRSSSGIAVNNFVRNILSCTFAIVSQPIIDVIGHAWLLTTLALVCWISGYTCIWALRAYGPVWRTALDRELNG